MSRILVVRGGSWPYPTDFLCGALRNALDDLRYTTLGFRVVQDPKRYVVRGCCWGGLPYGLRSPDWLWYAPNFKYYGTGFRTACDAEEG